jgi:hypothetical protein
MIWQVGWPAGALRARWLTEATGTDDGRAGVREDLERRVRNFGDGTWQAASPAVPSEARRLLDQFGQDNGRIAVDSGSARFRPVIVNRRPAWWSEEATRLITEWQPPSGQKDSGGTTSSPSPCGGSKRP